MKSSKDSWEKFLHPDILASNLVCISLFITAYEIFKCSIISKPEEFFTDGILQGQPVLDAKYQTDVLSRSKSKLLASLLWLEEMGAVDSKDIEVFQQVRKFRNELAHETLSYVSDANKNIDASYFEKLIGLLSKIEKWWVINFELSIDPEALPEGANPDDIIPGPIWNLQLMMDIALGNEPEKGYYYNAFKKSRT